MKKLGREPQKLETLNLFSLLQSGDGSTLYDPANRQSFLSQVDSGLTRALDSEATLHGIRVQSMFQGVVASLDYVRLLKEEDAGNCYCQIDDEIRIPDFRVITTKGESWLIETKNYFSKDPMRRYRIRNEDVQRLKRYAEIVGTPLRAGQTISFRLVEIELAAKVEGIVGGERENVCAELLQIFHVALLQGAQLRVLISFAGST
jgi:hypothetical protein